MHCEPAHSEHTAPELRGIGSLVFKGIVLSSTMPNKQQNNEAVRTNEEGNPFGPEYSEAQSATLLACMVQGERYGELWVFEDVDGNIWADDGKSTPEIVSWAVVE